MFRCSIRTGLGLWSFLFLLLPLHADTPPERHGSIEIVQPGIQVRGGFTLTWQHASDPAVRDEALGSFDLVSIMPWRAGYWTLYVEGNLSPRSQGIHALLPVANADAGSALDRDGRGRLQVSELRYSRRFGKRLLSLGLIDPTDMLDNSAVANDETRQFINANLVNNPTIAFPDYTLGLSWHRDVEPDRLDITVFMGSSHGLADNPDASYSELVDVTAPGKGLFLALETYWTAPGSLLRLGAWMNSAAFPRLDTTSGTATNHGLYAVFDFARDNVLWMLRAGLANPAVSPGARFLSLGASWPVWTAEAGMGVAWVGQSRKALDPDLKDELDMEAWLRLSLTENLEITPSIQWLQHPDLDIGSGHVAARSRVATLRLNYLF